MEPGCNRNLSSVENFSPEDPSVMHLYEMVPACSVKKKKKIQSLVFPLYADFTVTEVLCIIFLQNWVMGLKDAHERRYRPSSLALK